MITHVRRLIILSLTLILCVGCDQTTKYTVRELLPPDATVSLVNDAIRFQYTENKGAFMSVGASLSDGTRFWVFTVSVCLVLAMLFLYLVSSKTLALPPVIAISLILGGGVSNLIDRFVHKGVVIDYLNIGIGSLRTGTFNVADVAIFAGVGLLVGSVLLSGGPTRSGSNS